MFFNLLEKNWDGRVDFGDVVDVVCDEVYTLIGVLECDTRKYHEFVAGYCLQLHSTSKECPRQGTFPWYHALKRQYEIYGILRSQISNMIGQ